MADKKFITPTEKEIFCRLAGGQRNKEIADVLSVHENMIDYHLRKVRQRFNCSTNMQALSLLQSAGLLA